MWDVATAIDSLGWVAEFRIPFSQIRFAEQGRAHVRLHDRARRRADGRAHQLAALSPRRAGLRLAGRRDLAGIAGLPTPRRLEVVPYAWRRTDQRTRRRPERARRLRSSDSRSQPERTSSTACRRTSRSTRRSIPTSARSRPIRRVLNLSAFEQFFEERRPFFLEGAGIFSFRTAAATSTPAARGLFYSRRIGRAPQLAGELRRRDEPDRHDDPRRGKDHRPARQRPVGRIARRGDAARARRRSARTIEPRDELRRRAAAAGSQRWAGRHRSR